MPCDLSLEAEARALGYCRVAGVDEVGRGALAGPVVAAAVVFADRPVPEGINDSKLLSPKRREALYEHIFEAAACVRVSGVDAEEIDRINVLQASLRAMRSALDLLDPAADYILIDGNVALPRFDRAQRTVIGGDRLSVSIAAASIIAKVTRDRMLREFEGIWPGYGFAENAGYGTRAHRDALRRLGPSPVHRRSFQGVLQAPPLFPPCGDAGPGADLQAAPAEDA